MQKIKVCLWALRGLRGRLYNIRIILAALSGEPLRAGKGSHPSVNTGPFFVQHLSTLQPSASACQHVPSGTFSISACQPVSKVGRFVAPQRLTELLPESRLAKRDRS